MNVIDFGNLDITALRASVEDEDRADLLAAAGRFGEAAALMKNANKARRKVFGKWPIRELREFTLLALANAQRIEAGTDETLQAAQPKGESLVPKGCAHE